MTIHLQGSKYDRTFFIVFPHRLVGQFIQRILETVIFRIDNQTDIVLISTLAESHKAFFKFAEGFYFFDGQFAPFFRSLGKKFIGRYSRRFEYGISQVIISFGKID